MDINDAAHNYFAHKTEQNCSAVTKAAEPLVVHFARLYGGNCGFEDLYQTGMEGLLKALSTYNPSYGTAFSTWASECIISTIRHYVRKEASYTRPGCIVELQSKVDRIVEQQLKETGEAPSVQYIAEHLGVTESSVLEVMRAGMVSIDELEVDNIKTLQYSSFHLPIEDSIAVAQALSKLSSLQQKVIRALFFKGMTQEQVAAQLGLNQKKVSRLKLSGLNEMAGLLAEDSAVGTLTHKARMKAAACSLNEHN
ncbi:sigma-70 family RNA polymerase sigma factor [Acetanaerobacterium elongatum]|uniref:RNA polymerase sigma-B factor n=1 Tax=Acetanaerobacterium elongatum TaxID=258515 RepID=A0A1G9V4Y9_9FIRM|nr:sigma-70 family RNA polymerase sigma factor [Acetanaerobacterium elongatum]SDM67218.1 RNA polymerase sigma-B factor [Acetanaerobacterium elongatum]